MPSKNTPKRHRHKGSPDERRRDHKKRGDHGDNEPSLLRAGSPPPPRTPATSLSSKGSPPASRQVSPSKVSPPPARQVVNNFSSSSPNSNARVAAFNNGLPEKAVDPYYGGWPSRRRRRPLSHQSRNRLKKSICAVFVVGILAAVGVAVTFLIGAQDSEPLGPVGVEIRGNFGQDHIGVIFLSDMTVSEQDPFIRAAEKWSKVIAANPLVEVLNGNDIIANVACSPIINSDFTVLEGGTNIDHLIVVIELGNVDGPGNDVSQSSPCATQARANGDFPFVGAIRFDSEDLDRLKGDGTLRDVALHQMGHVIGIGSLWKQPGDELIDNPVLNAQGSPTNDPNPPVYLGAAGNDVFENDLNGGSNQAPIEDGLDSLGNPLFDLTQGKGLSAVDAHWDKDTFGEELMTFQLNPNVNDHPLSLLTVRSVEDLGYSVNTEEAEAFTLPSALISGSSTPASLDPNNLRGDSYIDFSGDIPMNMNVWTFSIDEGKIRDDFKPTIYFNPTEGAVVNYEHTDTDQ